MNLVWENPTTFPLGCGKPNSSENFFFFFLIDNAKLFPAMSEEATYFRDFEVFLVGCLEADFEHLRCHHRTSAARPSASLRGNHSKRVDPKQDKPGNHSPQLWYNCPVNQEGKNLPWEKTCPLSRDHPGHCLRASCLFRELLVATEFLFEDQN